MTHPAAILLVLAVVAPVLLPVAAAEADRRPAVHNVNIIDGADGRDSILATGPALGLSPEEIARIRKASGYVGCREPSIALGSGALFLTNNQILTAAHIFFEPSGKRRSRCIFKNQDASRSMMIDLVLDGAKFGAEPPKAGSNDDYAIVKLAEPIVGAEPFPVEDQVPVRTGDRLIAVSAHPAGMAKQIDINVPVAGGCTVRRAPRSARATSFYRTDCDATGASSGSLILARVGGRLVFRGMIISTGPWRDPGFAGAPYDEAKGSATTALGVDAAILKAGKALAGTE
jgi:hypothetical protein